MNYQKNKSDTSLYLKGWAIHGCVLCEKNKPLVYMEDVGSIMQSIKLRVICF